MLLETNKLKIIIFWPAVVASCVFSVIMFAALGSNYFTKTLWSLVALAAIVWQVLSLREWFNSVFRKRRDYIALAKYLTVTVLSVVSTIVFGVMDTEKDVSIAASGAERLQTINREIAAIYAETTDAEDRQVQDLAAVSASISNKTVYEAVLLNKAISRIHDAAQKKETERASRIESLQKEKSEIVKAQDTKRGAFAVIGSVIGASSDNARVIFLAIAAVIIELMVYSSASWRRETDGKKEETKKKKTDQLSLFSVAKSA